MATEHFSHRHSLTFDHTQRTCGWCRVEKWSDFYGCNRCDYYICKSCFGLPQEIKHPFHTKHPLTLRQRDTYCDACGKINDFMYNCSECSFDVDVNCATLMPCDRSTGHQKEEQLSHLGHPLIPCDHHQEEGLDFECSACLLPFKKDTMTIYVCLKCRAIMHKSCADLPPEIKHPFHPPHPLLLRNHRDYRHPRVCDACERGSRSTKYWCPTCDFKMDTTCVSMRPTVKFELHPHPLVFFNNKQNIIFKDCGVHGVCTGHQLTFPFFRCVQCDFNAFPPAFKHSNHRHSLTLTHSPIKDHSDDKEDSEYYCDVCEDRRLLKQPTYYCQECHYVAHVSCVFQEMLPLPERKLSDQEIILLQEELDALTVKSEKLIKKLDELKERGAQQIDKKTLGAARDDPAVVEQDKERIILQAEVDALKTKLETIKFVEFKEGRAQHIGDYQITGLYGAGIIKVNAIDASIDLKTFSIVASDHSVIAKPDKEILIFQAKVDALSAELKSLTIKLDELKVKHMQHVGGNQIEGIPSLGTKASAEDEENDATFSTLTKLDEERKAQTTELETLKKKHDEEMEALITKLETLKKKRDEEIGALIPKLETLKKKRDEEMKALTTKLEALKKKHDEEIEKKRAHNNEEIESLTMKLEALKKKHDEEI